MSSLDGPRKDDIGSLQTQIDYHLGEIYLLKHAQNSRVPIFCLPAELLSGVFLYLVVAGIQYGDANFATGTFNFLQVCRRWNEVAVTSPRLWVWWVAGAAKAWHLFKSRSKDSPQFLAWRPQLPDSVRDILTDAAIPGRVRQLDFSGTYEDLGDFLGGFNPSPPPNASSIRIHIIPRYWCESPESFARFLSSAFPKLSELDVEGFLPEFPSPIFTTSDLTSLKLCLPDIHNSRPTLSQFTQILQQHPNLRELDLQQGGMPLTEPSGPLVSFTLPKLVDLRLRGMKSTILRLIDLVGMSSPLHNVVIHFEDPRLTTPTLVGPMEKVLTAYYGCPGLGFPRMVNCLTISSNSKQRELVFEARSCSTSASNQTSNLKLQFNWARGELVKEAFLLFPLERVHTFAAVGLDFDMEEWCTVLQKSKELSHLRIEKVYVNPLLDALDVSGEGMYKKFAKIRQNWSLTRTQMTRNYPPQNCNRWHSLISTSGPIRMGNCWTSWYGGVSTMSGWKVWLFGRVVWTVVGMRESSGKWLRRLLPATTRRSRKTKSQKAIRRGRKLKKRPLAAGHTRRGILNYGYRTFTLIKVGRLPIRRGCSWA